MKKVFFAIVLLIPGLLFSNSRIFLDQSIESKATHSLKNNNYKILEKTSAINKRPYNVQKYTLTLDWRSIFTAKTIEGENRYYKGINKIDIRIDTVKLDKIELDAANQLIDSIKSNSFEYQPTYTQLGNKLIINFPSTKLLNDTVSFEIYYTYIGKDNIGFYLYPKNQFIGLGPAPKRDSIFLISRIAYTMSEPNDAHYWMPCNDQPDDKAYFEVNVQTPLNIMAVSNGIPSVETLSDSKIWHFKPQYPMATYLMAVTASEFQMHQDFYNEVTNPDTSIPLFYYVWEDDWASDTTNGGAYNAQYSFRNVPKMIEVYANLFGEYPFESYGMVAIQPFGFGGMEHQTMTSINRTWLRGWYETGIAHELSHQWIGDLMTCATWYDIWQNEGGATWCEALWVESYAGISAYDAYLQYYISWYFKDSSLYQIPIYAIPIDGIFTYPLSTLTYNKAGFVYNMLRKQIGDSTFFPAFRNILKKFSLESVETSDLIEAWKEQVPNFDFDTFFEQWIYSAGHPILKMDAYSYIWGSNNYKITLNISQTQTGMKVPFTFKTPIRILFFKDSTEQTYRDLYLSKHDDTLETFISFRPDSVAIDQTYLLCQVTETTLGINDNSIDNNNITLFPNPVSKGNNTTIKLGITDYSNLDISIFDELGRKIKEINKNYIVNKNSNIEINTNELQTGIYFIKISSKDNLQAKFLKLIIM